MFATYFLDKILFLGSFTWRRLTTERYKWLDSTRVGVCGYRQYSVQCIHSNVLMATPINTSRTRVYWNVRVEMIWPSLHLQSTVEYLNAEDEKIRCRGKQRSNTRFKKRCYRFQDCNVQRNSRRGEGDSKERENFHLPSLVHAFRYLVTSPPTKSPLRIELSSVSIISNLHERKFPNRYFVFIFQRNDWWLWNVSASFFNLSNAKVYIYRTYTCIISICITKSIRRSTQG